MVEKIKKLLKVRIRPEIEIGSDTGIEEELSRPAQKIEERKRRRTIPPLGFKIKLRW